MISSLPLEGILSHQLKYQMVALRKSFFVEESFQSLCCNFYILTTVSKARDKERIDWVAPCNSDSHSWAVLLLGRAHELIL